MSNTQRPTLTPRSTRGTEKAREDALNQGLRLTIEGKVYEARVGDVTPEIARELRRATGMGFLSLIETTSNDPDIDVVCAFVWVARLIKGEQIEITDVQVGYAELLADGFDVALPKAQTDEELEDNSPEA